MPRSIARLPRLLLVRRSTHVPQGRRRHGRGRDGGRQSAGMGRRQRHCGLRARVARQGCSTTSLSRKQRKKVCFAWDYIDKERGLLRTLVANNWNITDNDDHGRLLHRRPARDDPRTSSKGIIQPDWHEQIDKQLEDDAGGYGNEQSIAIFGKPGDGKFEFVMTGRHMTLRCDGNSAEHVAFGGPIFYGHAASGFNEKPDPPGQRLLAAGAGRQQGLRDARRQAAQQALVDKLPRNRPSASAGPSDAFPGIPARASCRAISGRSVQKVLAEAGRALSPARSRRGAGLPEGPGRSGEVLAGVLQRRRPGNDRCGTAGGWKARRSSGTSAAPRTSTCGSTWRTTPA